MAGPTCHISVANHNNHFGPHGAGHHPTVVGFQQERAPQSNTHQAALHRGRSLLSKLLLKGEDASAHYEVASMCSIDQEESETEEQDEDYEWDRFCSSMEVDRLERLTESDTCSNKSQPVPIPSLHHSYFKDEMQRAALEKLNQKRKWYQQQLEAERMMSRSIAKSKQGAAAAKCNKPTGRPGAPV